jgi:hypothetical protein
MYAQVSDQNDNYYKNQLMESNIFWFEYAPEKQNRVVLVAVKETDKCNEILENFLEKKELNMSLFSYKINLYNNCKEKK